jgi:Fur family transcriptional regulator, ferric uptake regulator
MKASRELDVIRTELKLRSYRITKPRMAVIAELVGVRRYVTARQLHARLERARAGVGLATVYRTLETLQAVHAVSTQPAARGELGYLFCPVAHHHHAVCTKCGKVEDVPCKSSMRFERALENDLRFRLTRHSLEFFGLCARCS